jgi:hypothetical protein
MVWTPWPPNWPVPDFPQPGPEPNPPLDPKDLPQIPDTTDQGGTVPPQQTPADTGAYPTTTTTTTTAPAQPGSSPSSSGGGGAAPGVGPIAGWPQFIIWLAALAALWFILTALAEAGYPNFAYAIAGLILTGALLKLGPHAFENARKLIKT